MRSWRGSGDTPSRRPFCNVVKRMTMSPVVVVLVVLLLVLVVLLLLQLLVGVGVVVVGVGVGYGGPENHHRVLEQRRWWTGSIGMSPFEVP